MNAQQTNETFLRIKKRLVKSGRVMMHKSLKTRTPVKSNLIHVKIEKQKKSLFNEAFVQYKRCIMNGNTFAYKNKLNEVW